MIGIMPGTIPSTSSAEHGNCGTWAHGFDGDGSPPVHSVGFRLHRWARSVLNTAKGPGSIAHLAAREHPSALGPQFMDPDNAYSYIQNPGRVGPRRGTGADAHIDGGWRKNTLGERPLSIPAKTRAEVGHVTSSKGRILRYPGMA